MERTHILKKYSQKNWETHKFNCDDIDDSNKKIKKFAKVKIMKVNSHLLIYIKIEITI